MRARASLATRLCLSLRSASALSPSRCVVAETCMPYLCNFAALDEDIHNGLEVGSHDGHHLHAHLEEPKSLDGAVHFRRSKGHRGQQSVGGWFTVGWSRGESKDGGENPRRLYWDIASRQGL
jgi:hypothetical protein